MATTMSYGNWNNRAKRGLDLEWDVRAALGEDAENVEAIIKAYREAINDALPPGVSLHGNEFYGPAYAEDCNENGYPLDEDGSLDIKAIVDSVDFWAVAGEV